ncbi:MAG: hypothetical protein V4670_12270 [Bacteroidota bacterium]
MENKLRSLKLKKARLFSEIESLSSVSELMFLNFGKVEAEILLLEKQIVRETKNHLDEN